MKQSWNSEAHLRAIMMDCFKQAKDLMLEIKNLRAPNQESLHQRIERLSLKTVLINDYVDLMNCYTENLKLLHTHSPAAGY
jgi:hypothetical protein